MFNKMNQEAEAIKVYLPVRVEALIAPHGS